MRDIEEAAALEPDHISAYNLTFEEGTAFFTEMRHGRICPLESDEQAEMYAAVRENYRRAVTRCTRFPTTRAPAANAATTLLTGTMRLTLASAQARITLRATAPVAGDGGTSAVPRATSRWRWNGHRGNRQRDSCAKCIDGRVRIPKFAPARWICAGGLLRADSIRASRRFSGREPRLFEGGMLENQRGRIRLTD